MARGEGSGHGSGGAGMENVAIGTGLIVGLICCCLCIGLPLFASGLILVIYEDECGDACLPVGIALLVACSLFCIGYLALVVYVCQGGCQKTPTQPSTVIMTAPAQGQVYHTAGQGPQTFHVQYPPQQLPQGYEAPPGFQPPPYQPPQYYPQDPSAPPVYM